MLKVFARIMFYLRVARCLTSSDEVNEVPTMIDEFERYTNKEVVASVFENYCRWEEVNDGIEKLVGAIDSTRKLIELTLDNERNRIERMEPLSVHGRTQFCNDVSGRRFFWHESSFRP